MTPTSPRAPESDGLTGTEDWNVKKHEIPVRETTYQRLRDAARKNGEQLGTYADALINRWLDEREKVN